MVSQAKTGVVIEGKYRLERELGSGGMGAVWLATQMMVDRKVAVKLLHPAFLDQDDLQARFEVEAKAIGRLNHPNCITLYDFGFSSELHAFYTVIEYIDGVSLDTRLGTNLEHAEIVNIIKSIALALDHAHYHGILHRDLKPENVMLAKMTDGTEMVKVLDFGIARIVKGQFEEPNDESQRITKAGEVFGTPAYMSPEQARSIRQLTPAADLYSLGVMFYELLEGELPFFANSAFDLLMLHVTKPVPAMKRSVPPELEDIVMRLLAKDPSNRFQSGKELSDALSTYDPSFEVVPTRVDIPVTDSVSADDVTARRVVADNPPSNVSAEFEAADTDPSVVVPGADAFQTQPAIQIEEDRRRVIVGGGLIVVLLLAAAIVLGWTLIQDDPVVTAAESEPSAVDPPNPTKSGSIVSEPSSERELVVVKKTVLEPKAALEPKKEEDGVQAIDDTAKEDAVETKPALAKPAHKRVRKKPKKSARDTQEKQTASSVKKLGLDLDTEKTAKKPAKKLDL